MPRIELSGKGEHLPEYALPPFGSDSVIPPTILTYTDNAEIPMKTYKDLGYTHFEVWCIGGAGGRGGGVQTINPSDPSYAQGIIPSMSFGGEGGGGGLHKGSGLLADLPDAIPVVVGKEGAAGQDGNRHYRWLVVPGVLKGDTNIPSMVDGAGNAIPPYFFEEITDGDNALPSIRLFYPNPYYVEPIDGSDGGASYFHEPPLVMASGGTGGKKSPVFSYSSESHKRLSFAMLHAPGGEGGQGGVGGSLVPGGGGDGGKASELEFTTTAGPANDINFTYEKHRTMTGAEDGFWDGLIGEGGGGGRGGTTQTNRDDRFPPNSFHNQPTIIQASSGGKGSFSFSDTSVYGQAGTVGTSDVIPGAAGGARVLKNNKYGSRFSGYSPNGVVIVRLVRIAD